MSLVANKSRKVKVPGQKKQSRPDWDFTLNDLTEFRATPEEVVRRQEAHRSKNLELVRKAAIEKRIAAARRQALGDYTNKSSAGNAFLREILYSNGEANQLLDDTCKALQVAHDVFGDDARRYKAIPAITSVGSDDEENAVYHSRPMVVDGLIKSRTESQTKLEKLSDSVMKKTALNETYSTSSSESDSDTDEDTENQDLSCADYETTPAISHPPRIDLQRFQKLIEQENLSTIASESSAAPITDEGVVPIKTPPKVEVAVHGTQTDENIKHRDCERQKKKTPKRKKSLPSAESTDLTSLLAFLENDLSGYEKEYCVEGDNSIVSGSSSSFSMSTFTVSLINVLRRMMGFFNKLQDNLLEERRHRAIKDQQLLDLTNRTDLLTKELIETQEQFHVVLDELTRVKTEQRQEIDTIKSTLARVAKGGTVHTVQVAQPQATVLGGVQATGSPTLTLRLSGSSPKVTTYKEFEGSPEQMKLMNSSQAKESAATDGSLTAGAGGTVSVDDEGMTLEQRIEQLRGDHQETLERFRKLGMEMQKEHPKTAACWLTDNE